MNRLRSIKAQDFLTLRNIGIQFKDPLTIICGPNWSGKTSIQNAIRVCLTGEIPRVSMAKYRGQVIRNGSKGPAKVQADWDGELWGGEIGSNTRLPTECAIHPALLEQHRLSRAPADQRRKEILEILGATMGEDEIRAELQAREANMEFAELVLPMFPAGFEAMAKECEAQAKMGRARWKDVTGETYGAIKAADWKADISEITERAKINAPHLKQREKLVAEARATVTEIEQSLAALRLELMREGQALMCTHCGGITPALEPARADELRRDIPSKEKALEAARTALRSRETDLKLSQDAQAEYDNAEAIGAQKTAAAAKAHAETAAWVKLQELLSPEGIPSILLEQQLGSINARLVESSAIIGLGAVSLEPDMTVRRDGRPYPLLSEAEQWVTDAQLVEALGHVTDARFLMLDRMDVLDLTKTQGTRVRVLKWLMGLAKAGTQVLVFATLKDMPKFDGVTSIWLEGGQVVDATVTEEETV